jgi:hypothetical protein
MLRKAYGKTAIFVVVLVLLLALDTVRALEGLPLLILALALALLATDRLRVWLRAHERIGLAMLPFMTAVLALLVAFCRGRNLSQGVLLLITIALVFDILLAALALIGEASKRGARGVVEFVGLAGVGIVVGLVLSLVFLVQVGCLGGTSLAEP